MVVLLCLVLLVAACSGQSNPTTNDSGNGGTSSAGGNASDEQVVIKLWWPGTDEPIVNSMERVIEQFEEAHPGIQVEYEAIPWAEYFQKISVGYAGGNAPDIHGLGLGQLMYTVVQEQYMDLNSFMEEDNWDGLEDIYPDILKAGQWNGGQYGLLFPDVRVFSWRKDFFAEAGLDPEQPPQTLDELYEYARKLAIIDDKGNTTRGGFELPVQNGEQQFTSLHLLYGDDAKLYEESGNPLFDSEVSIGLLEDLVALYQDNAIIPSHNLQLEGTPYQNGQAAMAIVSPVQAAKLLQAVDEDVVGWSLPPKGPSGDQPVLMLGTFVTMNKDTKHPEAAWEFIKFWFEPEVLLPFAKDSGSTVQRMSLAEQFAELSAGHAVVMEALNNSRTYTPSEHWNTVINNLRTALEEAYTGIRTPEEALKFYADTVREEIGLK